MTLSLRKALRDLVAHRAQSWLVVISIATSLTAVGMVFTLLDALNERIVNSQRASQSATIRIIVGSPLDDNILHALSRLDGVGAINAQTRTNVHLQTADSAVLQEAILVIIRDFTDQPADVVRLVDGRLPNGAEVGVEAAHLSAYGLPEIGAALTLQTSQQTHRLPIVGTFHSITELGPPLASRPVIYADRSMLERLGLPEGFSILQITLQSYSEVDANSVANTLQDRLHALNIAILSTTIENPSRHVLGFIVDGIGFILQTFAIVALLLSFVIIVNMVNTILLQQTSQIAVMKTYGASQRQIQRSYLLMIWLLAWLSVLIALPLALLLANSVLNFLSLVLNLPGSGLAFSLPALSLQIGLGLLMPLLVAWFPIQRAARISVREALGGYGLSNAAARPGLSSLGRSFAPLMIQFMLRNASRNPNRTLLTCLILMISGVLFMAVRSTEASFMNTMNGYFGLFSVNLSVELQEFEPAGRMDWLMNSYPDITQAESWIRTTGTVILPSGEGRTIYLSGYPQDSTLYQFRLSAGRLPDEESRNELLLNRDLAHEHNIGVGDQIAIDLGDGRRNRWTVAGFVLDLGSFADGTSSAMMPRDILGAEIDQRYSSNQVYVQTQVPVTDEWIFVLQNHLTERGVSLTRLIGWDGFREQSLSTFQPITVLLLLVTFLVAIVGNIALSGLLSINVLERRREIGVLRSIGATSRTIGLIFISESVILALFSSSAAVLISLLVSDGFASGVMSLIALPQSYVYDWQGVLLWFVFAVSSALLASWLPARRAMQISIRDSLTYE